MSENSGGWAAFPQVDLKDSYGMLVPDRQPGMTLRDYFAARAMQGMLSNPECDLGPLTEIPQAAWDMADAMLRKRNK